MYQMVLNKLITTAMITFIIIAKITPIKNNLLCKDLAFVTEEKMHKATNETMAKLTAYKYFTQAYAPCMVTQVTVEEESNLDLLVNEAYYHINNHSSKK